MAEPRNGDELARVLMRKAAGDEIVLVRLIEDDDVPDDVLGFHAQQAVEKMIKAVLASKDFSYERTHNITYLRTDQGLGCRAARLMTASWQQDENKALVQRFYDEPWNRWQLDLADEIVSDDLRFRGSLGTECQGRNEFKRYAGTVRAAFPDWNNHIDEILATDDRVVTRMTWNGTHRGSLGDILPTSRRIEFAGAAFFRLKGSLIEEAWVVGDTQELWRGLGVLSLPL